MTIILGTNINRKGLQRIGGIFTDDRRLFSCVENREAKHRQQKHLLCVCCNAHTTTIIIIIE